VAALATFSLEVSVGFISLFCHSRHRCVRRFHSGFLFWVWGRGRGRGREGEVFWLFFILAFIYWSLSLSSSECGSNHRLLSFEILIGIALPNMGSIAALSFFKFY
jgi:hypothetical protein